MEARWSLSVEAQHRIAQRLALHPGQPGRFGRGHALQCVSDGQQPQSSPAIPPRDTPAQVSGLVVLTDRERGHDNALRHRPRSPLNQNALPKLPRGTTSLSGYYMITLPRRALLR